MTVAFKMCTVSISCFADQFRGKSATAVSLNITLLTTQVGCTVRFLDKEETLSSPYHGLSGTSISHLMADLEKSTPHRAIV